MLQLAELDLQIPGRPRDALELGRRGSRDRQAQRAEGLLKQRPERSGSAASRNLPPVEAAQGGPPDRRAGRHPLLGDRDLPQRPSWMKQGRSSDPSSQSRPTRFPPPFWESAALAAARAELATPCWETIRRRARLSRRLVLIDQANEPKRHPLRARISRRFGPPRHQQHQAAAASLLRWRSALAIQTAALPASHPTTLATRKLLAEVKQHGDDARPPQGASKQPTCGPLTSRWLAISYPCVGRFAKANDASRLVLPPNHLSRGVAMKSRFGIFRYALVAVRMFGVAYLGSRRGVHRSSRLFPTIRFSGEYVGELKVGDVHRCCRWSGVGKGEFEADCVPWRPAGRRLVARRQDHQGQGEDRRRQNDTFRPAKRGTATTARHGHLRQRPAMQWASSRKLSRKSPTLAAAPTALVLFDGTNDRRFEKRQDRRKQPALDRSTATGSATAARRIPRASFMPECAARGAATAGVYQQHRYEVQVLDSRLGLEGKGRRPARPSPRSWKKVNMAFSRRSLGKPTTSTLPPPASTLKKTQNAQSTCPQTA